MNINELITNVKKKIKKNVDIEKILIEDKTFLHRKHKNFDAKKCHLKIKIMSSELKLKNKIESNRYIYSILHQELKNNIHSIQLIIN